MPAPRGRTQLSLLFVLAVLVSGCGRVGPGGGARPAGDDSSGGGGGGSAGGAGGGATAPSPRYNPSNVYDTSCGKAYGESGLKQRMAQGCK